MQRIIISIFFISIVSFYSCQEVIELDLNSTNPVLVVDGEIAIDKTATVQLQFTSDYFTSEKQQSISDATVTLTASNGESEILEHISNGNYGGSLIIGIENTEYNLQVDLNDQSYNGSSAILSDFLIEEIDIIESVVNKPSFTRGESVDSINYNVEFAFTDDVNQENKYMLQIFKNGEVGEYSFLLIDDQLYEQKGSIQYNPMMYQFSKGDTVHMVLSILPPIVRTANF